MFLGSFGMIAKKIVTRFFGKPASLMHFVMFFIYQQVFKAATYTVRRLPPSRLNLGKLLS